MGRQSLIPMKVISTKYLVTLLNLVLLELQEDISYANGLSNVIMKEIVILTTQQKRFKIKGNETRKLWQSFPVFPHCYPFQLTDLLNLTESLNKDEDLPAQIWFFFNSIKDFGISLKLEEKIKSLKRRQLKQNLLSYVGPSFENLNLENPRYMSAMIRYIFLKLIAELMYRLSQQTSSFFGNVLGSNIFKNN